MLSRMQDRCSASDSPHHIVSREQPHHELCLVLVHCLQNVLIILEQGGPRSKSGGSAALLQQGRRAWVPLGNSIPCVRKNSEPLAPGLLSRRRGLSHRDTRKSCERNRIQRHKRQRSRDQHVATMAVPASVSAQSDRCGHPIAQRGSAARTAESIPNCFLNSRNA